MNRKNIGIVNKRYTVYKHISSWDGNFRKEVWNLEFQSDDKKEAFEFYRNQINGHWEIRDEERDSAKTISMSSY